jgi:hypothetical protein
MSAFDRFFATYVNPPHELEYMYTFHDGEVKKLDAKVLGVGLIDKNSGQLLTHRAYVPGHPLDGCIWYDSEENLLKSISYEI